eukprot:jgi/Chlat1/7131/Chrsp57S06805
MATATCVMGKQLAEIMQQHKKDMLLLIRRYGEQGPRILNRGQVVDGLDEVCGENSSCALAKTTVCAIISFTQEAVVLPPYLYLSVRTKVAKWRYFEIHMQDVTLKEIPVTTYLQKKERLVNGHDGPVLELDLSPFERDFPKMREASSIGKGVEFLNRFLSGRMFDLSGKGTKELVEFLRDLEHRGRQMLLNTNTRTVEELQDALSVADELLDGRPETETWKDHEEQLRHLGFEPGWGRSVQKIRSMMKLLADVLEAPSPEGLEKFLSQLPLIFTIAIVSPHGFFGQQGVLGKPDTGGQVVYILNQVRALEQEMLASIESQGLDIEPEIVVLTRLIPDAQGTTCNQPVERINGTKYARIVRVPFRNEKGQVIPQWISRFKIWPYLERFAQDAYPVLKEQISEDPDFVIGNYSDGNLVASMLARRLGVTQCNIAHALEVVKYPQSDLYWQDYEDQYHFSCQYTADVISMNSANFIITSTYQEIAGTKTSVGQYESYSSFTMPHLYRVVDGIDVRDPKFNIVAPGADPDCFFPANQRDRRSPKLKDVEALVYGENCNDACGQLEDTKKPLLFTMARLDKVKNITGLVEWYATTPELRKLVNLLVVGGQIDESKSNDSEEQEQIRRMHQLFEKHDLHKEVRWVVMQTDKELVGEFYRFTADNKGAFVQPALYEGFGLTVVEAMSCGLPTFGTIYGGPIEIIEDGVSGFHIDPHHPQQVEDASYWDKLSEGAIERVKTRYTWQLYAKRLLSLSRIYSFWRFRTNVERMETRRYLEMFYFLMFRKLAADLARKVTGEESTKQEGKDAAK